jgi:hypothetical protein
VLADRGRGRAVRRDQGRRRRVHPQGRRPGRPRHDHPPRRAGEYLINDKVFASRPSRRASSRSSASWRSTARRPPRSSRRSRRARSRSSTTSPRA